MSASDYPRLQRLNPHIELELGLLPDTLYTDSNEMCYDEYIYLGIEKSTNTIKQGAIYRTIKNQSLNSDEYFQENVLPEIKENFLNGAWYKVSNHFQANKLNELP